MQIADSQMAISVFLCVDEERDGQLIRSPRATAFLVAIRGEPFFVGYVVTAGHVIEGAAGRPIYLRLNTASGFDDIETQRDDWFIYDRSDVAAIRVKWGTYDLYSLYPEQFIGADYSLRLPNANEVLTADVSGSSGHPVFQVRTGDDVSIIGLFVQHYGHSKSLPIARTGSIARMPSEPVRYRHPGGTYSEHPAYLVELHSWGGLSGSPVYVHRRISQMQGNDIELIGFLGVISGHFSILQQAEATGDVFGEISVALNSGIAVVTPAGAVRELLWREDVLEDREHAFDAARKKREESASHGPEPDSGKP